MAGDPSVALSSRIFTNPQGAQPFQTACLVQQREHPSREVMLSRQEYFGNAERTPCDWRSPRHASPGRRMGRGASILLERERSRGARRAYPAQTSSLLACPHLTEVVPLAMSTSALNCRQMTAFGHKKRGR